MKIKVREIRLGETFFDLRLLDEEFGGYLYIGVNVEYKYTYRELIDRIIGFEKRKGDLRNLDVDIKDVELVEPIYLIGSYKDILKFLEMNPEFKTKKIIVGDIEFKKEAINELCEFLDGYDNIYVMLEGNTKFVSVSEVKRTFEIIDNMVNEIKSYDFSPLEQLIYAYDLVRDRVYVKEATYEDYSVSRDLTKVLLGDKIVCAGYANIFDKVVKGLGMNTLCCEMFRKDNHKVGHVRNAVYVEDDKYNICGVYYFDPTWDSKEEEENYQFLLSYKFLAKTRLEMQKYENFKYRNLTLSGFDENLYGGYEAFWDQIDMVRVIDTVELMSLLIDNGSFFNSLSLFRSADDWCSYTNKKIISEALKKFSFYEKYFEKPIKESTLLMALCRVRAKIITTKGVEAYPFNRRIFKLIAKKSGWNCFLLDEVLEEIDYWVQEDDMFRNVDTKARGLKRYW